MWMIVVFLLKPLGKSLIITASHNTIEYNGIKIMPTFHPAYLLRNPSEKRLVWEDMKKIRDLLRQ